MNAPVATHFNVTEKSVEGGSADLFCKVRGSAPDNSEKLRTYRTGPRYEFTYPVRTYEGLEYLVPLNLMKLAAFCPGADIAFSP